MAGDAAAIGELVTDAFQGPDEARIIEAVRAQDAALFELVADEEGTVVGHILFNRMACEPAARVAGLAPLAVAPAHRKAGIGAALSLAGIDRCRALGIEAIVVLGNPSYYPRFGFSSAAARAIVSPYAGQPAFMALALVPGALDRPLSVAYPAAFG